MNSLQPLMQVTGVEAAGWVTGEGDVIPAGGERPEANMQLLGAAQAVASIRQSMAEAQPATNEVFVRFSMKSLYVRNQEQNSLVVICRDSISVPTLRTTIRKILQAKAPVNPQANPTKTGPPRKRKPKSTRTGIWG